MSLWDDALFLWFPGSSVATSRDIINNETAEFELTSGTIVTSSNRTGRSYTGAVGDRFDDPVSSLRPTQSWSAFMVARVPSSPTDVNLGIANSGDLDQYAQLVLAAGADGLVELRANGAATPGGADWPRVTIPDQAGNTGFHVVIATFEQTGANTGTLSGYLDSTTAVGTDSFNSSSACTVNRLTVGRLEDSSPSNSAGGEIYAAGFWDRLLTAGEIGQLINTPFHYLDLYGPRYVYETSARNRQLSLQRRAVAIT